MKPERFCQALIVWPGSTASQMMKTAQMQNAAAACQKMKQDVQACVECVHVIIYDTITMIIVINFTVIYCTLCTVCVCYSIACYFFIFAQGGDALPTGLISKRLGLSMTWDDCKMRPATSGLLKHGAGPRRTLESSPRIRPSRRALSWFIEHVGANREVGLSEKSGGESACSFWRVHDSPQAYTACFLVDSKVSV